MAIGDAVAQMMGTATTNRQPASGVEEQITSIMKNQVADALEIYDGTNVRAILNGATVTDEDGSNGSQTPFNIYNAAIMINNSFYLRKAGTTDLVFICGVQTNV
jgi:hypothetical protein